MIAKHKDLKVVEKQTAKWQRNEAVDVVSGWLLNGTPIDAIAANNDEMAIGAIMALKQAKRVACWLPVSTARQTACNLSKRRPAVTIFRDAKARAIGAVQVTRAMLDHAKTEPYNCALCHRDARKLPAICTDEPEINRCHSLFQPILHPSAKA